MSDADGSGPVSRRTPRATDGGAPVSGALAIVLAVIAVVAGFLILRSISDDGDDDLGVGTETTGGDTDTGGEGSESTVPNTGGSLPAETTTPVQQIVTEGAIVIVANANGTAGSAASMSNALEAGPHFQMGAPEDASDALGLPLATSIIYYDPAQAQAQTVAQSLANVLGGTPTVQPLAGTPPVADGSIDGAGVLFLLGSDLANKTLAELNPAAATPAVITNPPTGSTAAP